MPRHALHIAHCTLHIADSLRPSLHRRVVLHYTPNFPKHLRSVFGRQGAFNPGALQTENGSIYGTTIVQTFAPIARFATHTQLTTATHSVP
jgi:hypothetical protein